MSKKIIYTIRSIGSDYEQKVYAMPWNTLEAVWRSQLCWHSPGSCVVVTNTETGESQKFYKEYKYR
jgi:hypothetical protein